MADSLLEGAVYDLELKVIALVRSDSLFQQQAFFAKTSDGHRIKIQLLEAPALDFTADNAADLHSDLIFMSVLQNIEDRLEASLAQVGIGLCSACTLNARASCKYLDRLVPLSLTPDFY